MLDRVTVTCYSFYMPSYDPREAEDRAREVQDQLSLAKRLLCTLCRNIEIYGYDRRIISDELLEWWDNHKILDRQRAEEEAKAEFLETKRTLLGLMSEEFANAANKDDLIERVDSVMNKL